MKQILPTCLFLLFNVIPVFALEEVQDGELFCTFSISGTYCLIPRIILYLLFLCGVVCYPWDWLVGAAFGTAMLFSSVTSLHLIVIAITESTLYWDPDSVPATNVVFYSLLAATFLVMWSSSFKNATKDTRTLVLLWALIMIAGLIAGMIYEDSPLYPVLSEETCNLELPPLRMGQRSIAMFFGLSSLGSNIDDIQALKILFALQIPLAFSCAIIGRTPTFLVRRCCGPWPAYWFWRILVVAIIFSLELALLALVLYHIVISEDNMIELNGWVSGEEWSAVGQWGQAIHTILTFGAAAVVSLYKAREERKAKKKLAELQQTRGV